jgi:hypothetical protein
MSVSPRRFKLIEDCKPGDKLDMGVFVRFDPRESGQGPKTWNVRMRGHDGRTFHYTETKGALVEVHGHQEAVAHQLVVQLLRERDRCRTDGDEYGADINDPDGWECEVTVEDRTFTVSIEEIERSASR